MFILFQISSCMQPTYYLNLYDINQFAYHPSTGVSLFGENEFYQVGVAKLLECLKCFRYQIALRLTFMQTL